MSKHTPGPWRQSGVDSHGRRLVRVTDTVTPDRVVALIPNYRGREEEMEATARLIAKASEMYELLSQHAVPVGWEDEKAFVALSKRWQALLRYIDEGES